MDRRAFLKLLGGAAASCMLPACAGDSTLRSRDFLNFGDRDRPFLGLATSLFMEHDYEARVEGKIPAALRGILYRNGPGLFNRGGMRKRSLLDGDGMVQSFTFHGTGVRYRNRFVQTRRYQEESRAGRFIYPSFSTRAPGGMLANFWPTDRLLSQAGITVFHWNGRLFALDESSLPYELDPENLRTIGETRFGLAEGFSLYSAHGKIDRKRGEWLTFGIRYGSKPQIMVTVFKEDGSLAYHRRIHMPRYVYFHDWFVSDRHLVFILHPTEIAIWGFLVGLRSMQDSLRWRPQRGNLLIVLDRNGTTDPVYLETEARFLWHSINAFDDGNSITGDFIGYADPDHFIGADPVVNAVMQGRKGLYRYPGEIRRYRINPAGRKVSVETLFGGNCEWPKVNELHWCHRYRYGYMAKTNRGEFFWSSVMRFDSFTGRADTFDFGAGQYCGEPVFVPLSGHSYEAVSPHEPGWILTEVYDSHTRKSFLAVLKSDRLYDGPLARIHLNHHVPFNYHGCWRAAT